MKNLFAVLFVLFSITAFAQKPDVPIEKPEKQDSIPAFYFLCAVNYNLPGTVAIPVPPNYNFNVTKSFVVKLKFFPTDVIITKIANLKYGDDVLTGDLKVLSVCVVPENFSKNVLDLSDDRQK